MSAVCAGPLGRSTSSRDESQQEQQRHRSDERDEDRPCDSTERNRDVEPAENQAAEEGSHDAHDDVADDAVSAADDRRCKPARDEADRDPNQKCSERQNFLDSPAADERLSRIAPRAPLRQRKMRATSLPVLRPWIRRVTRGPKPECLAKGTWTVHHSERTALPEEDAHRSR
jgi:hypothetical protein